MTKLRGLSLFSNVGVAESGIKSSDFVMMFANELIEKRARFYEAVHPKTTMIQGDITNDTIRTQIVNKAIEADINFIIATPPCQGMSEAGLRCEFDERNQLITYVVDVVNRVKPSFVIIENVPKIITTKIIINGNSILISDYLKIFLKDYKFNNETIIRAMDYGIPQMRKRNIYLLVRKGVNVDWKFPPKQDIITLEQAIGDLPSLDPMLREGIDLTLEKFPDFYNKRNRGRAISKWHYPPTHSWRQVNWMMHTPSGTSAIYNKENYPIKKDGNRIKAHHNNYRRMAWDKPSRTITQNNGVISSLACVHPGRPYIKGNVTLYSDPRVLSIYELLIVSSLPLDWNIPSWANECFIRNVIGEGIPSKLITILVEELLKQI